MNKWIRGGIEMFPEEIQERHLAELGTIKRYMDEIEIEAVLLKRDAAFPLHTLVINVEEDHRGRQRSASLNYLPINNEDFEFIHLLQFYTVLLFDYEKRYKDDLQKLLFFINRLTAIGDFNFKDETEIDFRYVYTASTQEIIPQAEISETVFLFALMLDMYAEWIEDVGTGKKTYNEVIDELNKIAE